MVVFLVFSIDIDRQIEKSSRFRSDVGNARLSTWSRVGSESHNLRAQSEESIAEHEAGLRAAGRTNIDVGRLDSLSLQLLSKLSSGVGVRDCTSNARACELARRAAARRCGLAVDRR